MLVLDMGTRHVRRHDQHSDAAFVDGGLACQYGLALRLLRRADFVAIDAERGIERLEIHLLREVESKLVPHYLTGDQNDRSAVPVCVGETVDEVQTARSTRPSTGGQLTGQLGVRAGCKAASLLVANENPSHVAALDRATDVVEGIPGNAIATLHAGLAQHVDDYVGHQSAHSTTPLWRLSRYSPGAVTVGCRSGPQARFDKSGRRRTSRMGPMPRRVA